MSRVLPVLLLMALFCGTLMSQSQRKVLVEHFTQASCPPCASINPLLHPILERNKAKVTKITHQVSWPGIDPMNKDNPGEVQNRVNYYGVTGVPDIFLDAYSSGTPTVTISDATIQNAWLKPSPYEITVVNTVLPDYNSIQIEVTVKLTGSFSGNPYLRVATLEKVINWTTPPGTNGERVFYHVMKKFIPNTTGTSLAELNQTGQSKTFTFVYKFDKLYNFQNLETAAFIQDDATKEIHQSENAEVLFTPTPGSDIAIKQSNATGVYGDSIVCGNSTTPIIKVLNTGNKPVTSLDIRYRVNGGSESQYGWTGNLAFLKEVDIKLPAISFAALKGQNLVSVEVRQVNGEDDVNPVNNAAELGFQSAPTTTINATFEIKPVAQPAMLRFAIYDDLNQIILQDGPFTNNLAKTYFLQLQKDRCYRVVATNNTASLNGTYKVYDDQNVAILTQRVLGIGDVKRDFSTYSLVIGTQDESYFKGLTISPNPVRDLLSVQFSTEDASSGHISIFNQTGSNVWSKNLAFVSGNNTVNLDVRHFSPGIYFARLQSADQSNTVKFIVE